MSRQFRLRRRVSCDRSLSVYPSRRTEISVTSTGTPAPHVAAGSGITDASGLLDRITTLPGAALVAAVCGPGGTGKSTLLRAAARAYRAAGAPPGTEEGPILVDDAHRLGSSALHRLVDRASAPGARLIVAHRSGTDDGPGMTALRAAVARSGVTVVLRSLPRQGVQARIAHLLGREPPDALVDFVHQQSGGLPLLVDILIRTSGGGPDGSRLPGLPLPPDVVERFRHLVDALQPDSRRVLEALAVGAPPEPDILALLTGLPVDGLAAAVESARSTGYLDGDDRPVPFVRGLLLATLPALRRNELQRQLAVFWMERGGQLLPAARRMLGTGATGKAVAALFEAAADEALGRAPALAAELFAAAVAAGGNPSVTAGRRCAAAALAGDLEAALRLADAVLADEPTGPATDGEAVHARATAGVALAHRGFPARCAALTAALPATHPVGPVWAVPGLLAVGDAAAARAVLEDSRRAAESAGLARQAGVVVAEALLATVDGAPDRALAGLARAAVLLEPVAASTLLPDTPAALAALVAMQIGEFGAADDALRRAAARQHGGRPAQLRHLLLHGWVLLLRGRFRAAQEALERVNDACALQPRDELLASALQVALARRRGSATALAAGWARARAALLRHPVDLFMFLPLGELAIAAALLQDDDHLAPHLVDADRVLGGLGDPLLWAAPLRWAEAQAAVAAGRRSAADRHLEVLEQAAARGAHPAALAAAARTWVQVRWGSIDHVAAIDAARGLAAVGLAWEGAKLAGQAAVRCEVRSAAAALQACARELFRSTDGGDEVEAAPTAEREVTPLPRTASDESLLSERELAVGRLILDGLTYRQIGEQLYISAKTVENHVARMRRRLGAVTRNELFDRLRLLGAAERS